MGSPAPPFIAVQAFSIRFFRVNTFSISWQIGLIVQAPERHGAQCHRPECCDEYRRLQRFDFKKSAPFASPLHSVVVFVYEIITSIDRAIGKKYIFQLLKLNSCNESIQIQNLRISLSNVSPFKAHLRISKWVYHLFFCIRNHYYPAFVQQNKMKVRNMKEYGFMDICDIWFCWCFYIVNFLCRNYKSRCRIKTKLNKANFTVIIIH